MANTKKINYQKLTDELDSILEQLQSGDIGVDAALDAYERGLKITEALQIYLKGAENKITELKAKFSDLTS